MEAKYKNKKIEDVWYSKKYKWVHPWILRLFDYDEDIIITEELVEEIHKKFMAMIETDRPIQEYALNAVFYYDSMLKLDEKARARGYEDGYAQQYAAEYAEERAIEKRKSQLETSERMLRYGCSVELTYKVTKLPMEEIRELAQKIGVELISKIYEEAGMKHSMCEALRELMKDEIAAEVNAAVNEALAREREENNKNILNLAEKMLQGEEPLTKVMDYTGLTMETILELANKLGVEVMH